MEHDEIIRLTNNDYQATITDEDGVFVLWWTDYVANEWSENYTSLATALIRLALLAECKDRDWDAGFNYVPADHEKIAGAFIAGNVA